MRPHENQPYVVPVSLAYYESEDGLPCFYGDTTFGQKVEWMRANPLVCVEVDQKIAHDKWVSVIVYGRYEELPEASVDVGSLPHASDRSQLSDEVIDEREQAWKALKSNPSWWETSWSAWVARPQRKPGETYELVYYKIWIDRVTGHEATREATSH